MKKFKALCGVALCLAAIFAMQTVVFASAARPITGTATDVYEDFPVKIEAVVDQSSVRYIPLSFDRLIDNADVVAWEDQVPVTIEKSVLDASMLRAGVAITPKSSAGGCHVEVTRCELSILDSNLAAGQSLSISEVTLGEVYNITVTAGSKAYIGSFSCGVDVDNTVYVELDYAVTDVEEESGIMLLSTGAGNFYETEPNDSWVTADEGTLGMTCLGKLSSTDDIDIFHFKTPANGIGGSFDMALSAPVVSSGSGYLNYQMALYTKNENGTICLVGSSSQTGSTDDYLKVNNVLPNTDYYVRIQIDSPSSYMTIPNTTSYYYMNINYKPAKAWYSQYTGTSNGVYYWNTSHIYNLYFPSYSSYLPFIDENVNGYSIMANSTLLPSAAMVLRNMDARRQIYDFRMNLAQETYADPFTVTLANMNKVGNEITYNSSLSRYELNGYSESPTYSYLSRIADNFGTTYGSQSLAGLSNAAKFNAIASKLSAHPEGIIAWFQNGSTSVNLVIVDVSANTSLSYDQRIIVCDPDTRNYSRGHEVTLYNLFSASDVTTDSKNKKTEYLQKIYWFD